MEWSTGQGSAVKCIQCEVKEDGKKFQVVLFVGN